MKFVYTKYISILLFGIISYTSYSQALLAEIDLNRIPQKKIRHFICDQIDDHRLKLSDIEPSYQLSGEESYYSYSYVEDTFLIRKSLDKVWNSYCSTRMAASWDGKKISFGLLFSKWSDFIMYRSDHSYAPLDTGQVFFVNLKLLYIYNLAVGFEIINIDNQKKTIQFSYVKGGKSEGVQTIRFFNTEEGNTKIVHTSEFHSNSKFRDRRLYPRFHKKLVYEFHENMLLSLGITEEDLYYL